MKYSKTAFQRLSRAEQRVAIAKDAMEQLLCGTAVATVGVFLRTKRKTKHRAMREAVLESKRCEVCAKGAIILSTLRYGVADVNALDVAYTGVTCDSRYKNEFEVAPLWSTPLAQALGGAFSVATLARMEHVFELWETTYKLCYETSNAVRLFGILKNIIDNKGTFRPAKGFYDPAFLDKLNVDYKQAIREARS